MKTKECYERHKKCNGSYCKREHRCDAEIGRPGRYHTCRARAHFSSIELNYKYGDLHYCRRHAERHNATRASTSVLVALD